MYDVKKHNKIIYNYKNAPQNKQIHNQCNIIKVYNTMLYNYSFDWDSNCNFELRMVKVMWYHITQF